MTDRPTLLAVDGDNIAMRSIKAAEGRGLSLSTDEDEPINTGPLLLFINLISKYIRHVDPEYLVVCFDKGECRRRLDLFPEYKGNRSGGRRGVVSQYFSLMREWLSLSGIFISQREGFEADDLIGAYWRTANSMDMVILSGDKDLLQLVTPNGEAVQIRPQSGVPIADEVWDYERVVSEIGCDPAHLPIIKSLMGDNSDNINGLPGIGPKRASKIAADNNWVLEQVLSDTRCVDHRELIERNMALVNLRDILIPNLVVPPPFRPTEPESIAWSRLVDFYDRYQLESVKSRMFTIFEGESKHGEVHVQRVPI